MRILSPLTTFFLALFLLGISISSPYAISRYSEKLGSSQDCSGNAKFLSATDFTFELRNPREGTVLLPQLGSRTFQKEHLPASHGLAIDHRIIFSSSPFTSFRYSDCQLPSNPGRILLFPFHSFI